METINISVELFHKINDFIDSNLFIPTDDGDQINNNEAWEIKDKITEETKIQIACIKERICSNCTKKDCQPIPTKTKCPLFYL